MTSPIFARLGIVLSLPVLFLASGCSSSNPVMTDQALKQETRKERKAPLSEYEATLNPSDFDPEVEVVQKTHTEEIVHVQQMEMPKDSVVVEENVVQGFRMQIFSSASIDEASAAKTAGQEKFAHDSIYVLYDAPVYKVRVGDFVNRYEANQRLTEFIEKGYRDAWIVPDRILQRKSVSIPKDVPK
jgi:hypothetical protein